MILKKLTNLICKKKFNCKKTINFKIKSIHRKQMSLQNINMHEVGRQQIGNKNANLILNA